MTPQALIASLVSQAGEMSDAEIIRIAQTLNEAAIALIEIVIARGRADRATKKIPAGRK